MLTCGVGGWGGDTCSPGAGAGHMGAVPRHLEPPWGPQSPGSAPLRGGSPAGMVPEVCGPFPGSALAGLGHFQEQGSWGAVGRGTRIHLPITAVREAGAPRPTATQDPRPPCPHRAQATVRTHQGGALPRGPAPCPEHPGSCPLLASLIIPFGVPSVLWCPMGLCPFERLPRCH